MARRNGDGGKFTARNKQVAQIISSEIRAAAAVTQDRMASMIGKALSASSGRRGETVPWGKWERGEIGMKPAKVHQVLGAAVSMNIIKIDVARKLRLSLAQGTDSFSDVLPSAVVRQAQERLKESHIFASAKAALAKAVMRLDAVRCDLKHHRVVDVGEDDFDRLLDLVGYGLLTPSEMETAEKLSDAAVFRAFEPASVLLAQLARQHIEPVGVGFVGDIAGLRRQRPHTPMTRKQQREETELASTLSRADLVDGPEDSSLSSVFFEGLQRASVPRTFVKVRKIIDGSLAVPKLSQSDDKMKQDEAR